MQLGQWAASRTDLFPPAFCKTLSKLHSHVTPHSLAYTQSVICKTYKVESIEEIFVNFNPIPIGVGAIAQVYTATIKKAATQQDNSYFTSMLQSIGFRQKNISDAPVTQDVAIKVLHPNVEKYISLDLQILGFFAKLINLVPSMKWLSLPDEVKVFGAMLNQQLNLHYEALHLNQFRLNFRGNRYVEFPAPYDDYTTNQILLEDYMPGIPLSAFLKHKSGPFNKLLANTGNNALFQMLIVDNFTHADLHPGNVLVKFYKGIPKTIFNQDNEINDSIYKILSTCSTEEWDSAMEELNILGYRPTLVFLDAGLVTKLSTQDQKNFLDLFQAVLTFHGYEAGLLMVERSRQTERVINKDIFALKMEHLLNEIQKSTLSLKSLQIGTILQEVMTMAREHHVRIEANFANTVLSILLVEGAGRQLYPEMDLLSNATPYLRSASSKSNVSLTNPMVQLWIALEARQFLLLSTSKETVEKWVKSDMIAPNI